MVDLNDLYRFFDERCVKASSNLSFQAFVTAFEHWLPEDKRHECTRDDIFYLMQSQDRFDMHVSRNAITGQKVTVLCCAIWSKVSIIPVSRYWMKI